MNWMLELVNSKDVINKYPVLEKPKEEVLEVICQTKENEETTLEDCFVIDICLVVFELFSGYVDYYLVIPKVIITLASRAKLTNIRVILNTSTKVSIIILDTILRFEILIIYSSSIVLRIIIRDRLRFIGFTDNIPVTIRNSVIWTRFYIIDYSRIKIILGFPFIYKARVILRYPSDYKDRLVYILFCNLITREIISIKTNTKTENIKTI